MTNTTDLVEAPYIIEGSLYQRMAACLMKDGHPIAHFPEYSDAVELLEALSQQTKDTTYYSACDEIIHWMNATDSSEMSVQQFRSALNLKLLEMRPLTALNDVRDSSLQMAAHWIADNYANQDIGHEDFRVTAAMKVETALPPPRSSSEPKDKGWLPISEAPRVPDEYNILAVTEIGKLPFVATWDEQDETWSSFNQSYEICGKPFVPKYWMPIPGRTLLLAPPPPGQEGGQ